MDDPRKRRRQGLHPKRQGRRHVRLQSDSRHSPNDHEKEGRDTRNAAISESRPLQHRRGLVTSITITF